MTNEMNGIDVCASISWDVTVKRLVGCMTENDLDNMYAYEKNIMWKTFAFDSVPQGSSG